MSIYKLHVQKIEQGKPAFEVTFTVMVHDEADALPDGQYGQSEVESLSVREEHQNEVDIEQHEQMHAPDDEDIVVSDAASAYSVTVRLDRSNEQPNVGARNITFSDGCALARSL